MPVTLISFTSKAENNTIKLAWQTSTESNNKEFIVYRTGGDKVFVEIARITASGSPNLLKSYSYYDKSPLNGNNYYKLAQLDKDGKETDLGIRTVNFQLSSLNFRVYPNPTDDVVNVVLENGKYNTLAVYDVNGKVLQQIQISSNESSLTISLGNYLAGTYLLNLSGSERTETRKIVKK